MKYTHKLVCFFTVLMLLASCTKLDVEVYDQISDENYLLTPDDVKTALTGLYHEFRGGGWAEYNVAWGSLLTMQIGNTDECESNWNWDVQMDYLWRPETADMALFYRSMVPAVTRATALLEKLKTVSISAPVKRRSMAEIRCMRAMWAYDLYDLYGTVPLLTDPEIALNPALAQDYNPERPAVAWYTQFIETELKEALPDLPAAPNLPAGEYGRLTRGIAQMYLLKLYLHEAGQERHYRHSEPKAMAWWTKVDSIAQRIIDNGDYRLQDDYRSIWSPTNQRNSEVIFGIPNFPVGGLGNNFLAHALPADYVSRNNVPLTKWAGFLVPWAFYDSYDEQDKRRETLVRHYWNGQRMIDRRTEFTGKPGAIPMKYQENPNTNGSWDGSEYVINRYAEVLLAKAEAVNELSGPTAEAKELLHDVRRRAFANYDGSSHKAEIDAITSKEAFREHLLNERGWEFCWEGMRRPDLVRHGKLISNARSRGKLFAEDKHILYPIPQFVIYENPSVAQNDGY